MMNVQRGYSIMLLYLFTLLSAACSSERSNNKIRNIKTGSLNLTQFTDSNYVDVSLLKVYGNESSCHNEIKNANLYICKDIVHGDTLYVFDICSKIPSFAKENLFENFAILIEDIKKTIPDSLSIGVPDSFRIPSKAKAVFSNLTRLED